MGATRPGLPEVAALMLNYARQAARPESYATNYVGHTMTAPLPPPGWYPDPGGVNTQRYFDGTKWTDQLAPFRNDPVARAWLWFLSRPLSRP